MCPCMKLIYDNHLSKIWSGSCLTWTATVSAEGLYAPFFSASPHFSLHSWYGHRIGREEECVLTTFWHPC